MEFINQNDLKYFLDDLVEKYNHTDFIVNDPISIPHLFTKKQDIEIMGFWCAMLAWGQRITIINKSKELIRLMDDSPFDFIVGHQPQDLKRFEKFVHRTFNYTDTLYFIHFFKNYYANHDSLEWAFAHELGASADTIEGGLVGFHKLFFSLPECPDRTKKHIATPFRRSACKRMNMYLRWMVRKDTKGVDFGLWNTIKSTQLVCPCDLHVDRVARKLGLISRKQTDWQTALELTKALKLFDANDPVKYDFALFGLGIADKY